MKIGPLIQLGPPGAPPTLARTISTSGPSVSLARLPPLRKLAAVIMTHAVRQALLHLDDVIIAAADNTPTVSGAASGAGAGAATGSTASRWGRAVCSVLARGGGRWLHDGVPFDVALVPLAAVPSKPPPRTPFPSLLSA